MTTYPCNGQLYKAWHDMVARCSKPSHHAFMDYGGRGITVCKRWHSFQVFAADIVAEIGVRPGKGWSLDRKNNNGDYRRGNMRWATRLMQQRNTRRTKLTPHKVAEIRQLALQCCGRGCGTARGPKGGLTQIEIAARFGVHQNTVSQIARGVLWA